MKLRKRFSVLIAVLVLLSAPNIRIHAETQSTERFSVSTLWVMRSGEMDAKELNYVYEFTEASTSERFPLEVKPSALPDENPNPSILRVTADMQLPKKNQNSKAAVYALSALESKQVQRREVFFAVSSAESADPAHGASYYHRYRVFNQQINPVVTVASSIADALPATLTLSMASWAKGEDGLPISASVSKQVDNLAAGTVNLFELFAAAPDDAVSLRDFAAVELNWDGQSIAGNNLFSLDVQVPQGYQATVSGDDLAGYVVAIGAAP